MYNIILTVHRPTVYWKTPDSPRMSHSDLCHLLLPLYPVEWGGVVVVYMWPRDKVKDQRNEPSKNFYLSGLRSYWQSSSQMLLVGIAHLDSTIPCWQRCGSGLFIPDPRPQFLSIPHSGSWISDPGSLIPDPRSNNSNKRRGKIVVFIFFGATNFTNYFIFEKLQKKSFTWKIVLKIWVGDPGSGKNLSQISDPGSRGQKGTISVISDPDMKHRLQQVGQIAHCNFQTGT